MSTTLCVEKPDSNINLGSLLRLFKSDHFDSWMAINYLYRFSNNSGVFSYLCNEFYKLCDEDVEFYLAQICSLVVFNQDSQALFGFLMDKASKSVHFAIKIAWMFSALSEPKDMVISERCARLRRETEHATMNRRRPDRHPEEEVALINEVKNGDSKSHTEKLLAYAVAKKERCDYFKALQMFVEGLGAISDRLRFVNIDERTASLKLELLALNKKLVETSGIYIPLSSSSSPHCCLVHIPPDECVLLNSRERAPYLIIVEVLESGVPTSCEDLHQHAKQYQKIFEMYYPILNKSQTLNDEKETEENLNRERHQEKRNCKEKENGKEEKKSIIITKDKRNDDDSTNGESSNEEIDTNSKRKKEKKHKKSRISKKTTGERNKSPRITTSTTTTPPTTTPTTTTPPTTTPTTTTPRIYSSSDQVTNTEEKSGSSSRGRNPSPIITPYDDQLMNAEEKLGKLKNSSRERNPSPRTTPYGDQLMTAEEKSGKLKSSSRGRNLTPRTTQCGDQVTEEKSGKLKKSSEKTPSPRFASGDRATNTEVKLKSSTDKSLTKDSQEASNDKSKGGAPEKNISQSNSRHVRSSSQTPTSNSLVPGSQDKKRSSHSRIKNSQEIKKSSESQSSNRQRNMDDWVVLEIPDHEKDSNNLNEEGLPPIRKRTHSILFLREKWEEKEARIRSHSPFGHLPNWKLQSLIVKYGDDCRQERMALQLINQFHKIFTFTKLPLYLRPYKILILSPECCLIETVTNAMSVHQLKKEHGSISIGEYFRLKCGGTDSQEFKIAQANFIESIAAYSIVTFLLQLKDRHNGNILIDLEGHIVCFLAYLVPVQCQSSLSCLLPRLVDRRGLTIILPTYITQPIQHEDLAYSPLCSSSPRFTLTLASCYPTAQVPLTSKPLPSN